MWGFESKRNALREQLMLQAPEVNPSEFIRRYVLQQSSLQRTSQSKHWRFKKFARTTAHKTPA